MMQHYPLLSWIPVGQNNIATIISLGITNCNVLLKGFISFFPGKSLLGILDQATLSLRLRRAITEILLTILGGF
jgi:hypothetical protein